MSEKMKRIITNFAVMIILTLFTVAAAAVISAFNQKQTDFFSALNIQYFLLAAGVCWAGALAGIITGCVLLTTKRELMILFLTLIIFTLALYSLWQGVFAGNAHVFIFPLVYLVSANAVGTGLAFFARSIERRIVRK